MELGIIDYTDLGLDRDKWRAAVNMLINLWVPITIGKLMRR
jgi:hypothetical protein